MTTAYRFICTDEIELKRKAADTLSPSKVLEDFHFWLDNTAAASFPMLLDVHKRMTDAAKITGVYLAELEPNVVLQCAKNCGTPDGHAITGPYSEKLYVVKRNDHGEIYGFDVKE